MDNPPSFESSEEMVRRARERLATPIEDRFPTPPDEPASPFPLSARRNPSPSRPGTLRATPRRIADQARRTRIALAVTIVLLATGIAVFAAIAAGR